MAELWLSRTKRAPCNCGDLVSNQPLGAPLTTPGGAILSPAFSPDGNTVYAAGEHLPLQKYNISPERVAADLCKRIGGALSRDDWHAYISEAPYRRTC
ncbi:hypothetical protein [Wenjunlia tyrosinilytica]|uniref:Uncharacterized protein n=1 Tax=Wenjunlia tyrosinilytica TaxID=1544741 RepID=A0A918E0P1_9ACTN|nr:hypothetical protein [Wenjunlia tyrosinilytica]GGO99147.1 hypothetical protein GCM10012280_64950 [Wenjunlia tyrosinilytica]